MPLENNNKFNEVYLEYLENKTENYFSIDSFEEAFRNGKTVLFSKDKNSFGLVIIVGNYGNNSSEMVNIIIIFLILNK